MADSNLLIQPLELDPADFPPLPLQPGFLQLVTDELGDTATPADGFDDIVSEVIAIVDALEAGLLALNPTLEDTFAEADTIDAQPVSDTVDSFLPAVAVSSTVVDDLGVLLAGAATPTPPTPTPPAPTPASGGGIGPVAPCDESITFSAAVAGAAPVDYGLSFVNQTNVPVHVSSITLQQGSPAVFSIKASVPADIPALGALNFSVTVAAPQAGTFNALLTIISTQGTGRAVACISVTVSPAGTPVSPPSATLGGGGPPVGGGHIKQQ